MLFVNYVIIDDNYVMVL